MLNRVLLVGSLCISLALVSLVLLIPLLPVGPRSPLMDLFAVDVAVRRTALACAGGLAVTALVFFRQRRSKPPEAEAAVANTDKKLESKPRNRKRTRPIIGA